MVKCEISPCRSNLLLLQNAKGRRTHQVDQPPILNPRLLDAIIFCYPYFKFFLLSVLCMAWEDHNKRAVVAWFKNTYTSIFIIDASIILRMKRSQSCPSYPLTSTNEKITVLSFLSFDDEWKYPFTYVPEQHVLLILWPHDHQEFLSRDHTILNGDAKWKARNNKKITLAFFYIFQE